MSYDTTFGDRNGVEELVRAGSDCPTLSPGLRERIIAEAVSARALSVRESRRGRAGVVLAMSLALALFVGRPPSPSAIHADAVFGRLSLEAIENAWVHDSAAVVSTLKTNPDGLDWNQVESLSRLRRWQTSTLHSAFGS